MSSIDWSINYTAFAAALLHVLDLHRDAKVYPYGIHINPHSHLDGGLFIWLIAQTTPEQIALALQQARQSGEK